MEFLSSSIAAFLLTFLGMMLLIGEMLVKLRGFSGLLGFGFILLYFGTHLTTFNLVIMSSLYLVALLLIIIDGKVLNDGTLSFIGLTMMLVIIGLTTPSWITGIYGVIGVILGTLCSFLFLKVFPKRNMWDRITLFDRLSTEAGYNSINNKYEQLKNKQGVALTDLRPVGTIRIDNEEFSAVSNGKWIPRNKKIVVNHVDGTKILVDEVEN
ncbi:membrane-bound ClpP family serine protease [Salirhabdus euzebyi]|uniref:Membrane-bound ClpP family serine protease n=1 Tax=Salirhabdus euzebyi TaxID=394506 RepID=A0A841Q798_9BACI|nr:NfeD family protein [Salirhabdus euzebyi]MBB6454290.1 membrane-bound ClpP family serine protease [Salirhabdus euzebyi]